MFRNASLPDASPQPATLRQRPLRGGPLRGGLLRSGLLRGGLLRDGLLASSTLLAMLMAAAGPLAAQEPLASRSLDAAPVDNRPVAQLDLQRYSGQWHEIAHLPMFFQRKCVDRITARYTPRADGTIEVRNACRTRDGSVDESVGTARPVPAKPGQLEVRFAPDWLSWLPMVWADYWVIELDPDYRWAVVGGPDRKYLWVLSREESMDRAVFDAIKARAAQRGYPVDRLIMAAPLR